MCGDEVTSRTDPHRDIDLRVKLWNLKVVMLSVCLGLFLQCGGVHEIPYKEGRNKQQSSHRVTHLFFTNFDYIQANYTTYMMIVQHLYTTSSYQKEKGKRKENHNQDQKPYQKTESRNPKITQEQENPSKIDESLKPGWRGRSMDVPLLHTIPSLPYTFVHGILTPHAFEFARPPIGSTFIPWPMVRSIDAWVRVRSL